MCGRLTVTVEQRVHERYTRVPQIHSEVASLSPWLLVTSGLVAFDAVALVGALMLAYLLRFELPIPYLEILPQRLTFYSKVAFWAIPVWLGIFVMFRLYDRRRLFSGFQEYTQVVNACTIGVLAVIVISFLDTALVISRGWLVLVWALSVFCVCVARFTTRRLLRLVRARGVLLTPTLIVGTNTEGQALADHFLDDRGCGMNLIGFVRVGGEDVDSVDHRLNVLGDLTDLEDVIRAYGVHEVVVATTALKRDQLLDLYRTYGHLGDVEIRLSSGLFEILTTGVRVQEISSVPLMTPERARITGVDAVLKAVVDYAGATLGLIAFAPLMVAIAVLVKLDSPGPIFHRRRVLGQSGRRFDAFKFRTMVVAADRVLDADPELRRQFDSGFKLKVDPRVTRIGDFLRKTSLDELPQLLNVLRGEMSLVGPRMIAPEEALRYGRWRLNLLTVRPGITGPWQVRGRSDITYDERIRLSMDYIRNYSIWRDLEIVLRTIPMVLARRGAY